MRNLSLTFTVTKRQPMRNQYEIINEKSVRDNLPLN